MFEILCVETGCWLVINRVYIPKTKLIGCYNHRHCSVNIESNGKTTWGNTGITVLDRYPMMIFLGNSTEDTRVCICMTCKLGFGKQII